MERTCGNCRNDATRIHFDLEKCVFEDDRGNTTKCIDFDEWEPSYELLESQLARFSRHPFNAEDKGTWPPIGEEVLVENYINKKRRIVKWVSKEGGHYWEEGLLDNEFQIWSKDAFKWWSYLPGEEG